MSLITCPECGRDKVSDRAEACPNCGHPIANELDTSGRYDDSQDEPVNEAEVLNEARLRCAAGIGHVKSMKQLALFLWKDGFCDDDALEDIVHWSDKYVMSIINDYNDESSFDEVSEMMEFVLRIGFYFPRFKRTAERTVRNWVPRS